jgi:hypothetical protein
VYTVKKFNEIETIIQPIFKFTKLHTNKWLDFVDFYQAINIKKEIDTMSKIELSRTIDLKDQILSIKNRMNTGRALPEFNNTDPFLIPDHMIIPKINQFWLIGFIEGEGSFFFIFFKT